MTYTTQMNAARQGIITKEMELWLQKKQMDVQKLRSACGGRKSSYSCQ